MLFMAMFAIMQTLHCGADNPSLKRRGYLMREKKEKNTQLKLALRAIYENTTPQIIGDTHAADARKIIEWVLKRDVKGFDTPNPPNSYFADKFFNGNDKRARNAFYYAKRSHFITTAGRGYGRTFEINIQFLRGKMAEIIAKKPMSKNIFGDIGGL